MGEFKNPQVSKINNELATDQNVYEGEFRNPRPAKLGPYNTEYSHNNAG